MFSATNHFRNPVLSMTAHKISTLVLFPFPRSFHFICYFSHEMKKSKGIRFSPKLTCNLVAPHPVLPQNFISCSFSSPAQRPSDFFMLSPFSQKLFLKSVQKDRYSIFTLIDRLLFIYGPAHLSFKTSRECLANELSLRFVCLLHTPTFISDFINSIIPI